MDGQTCGTCHRPTAACVCDRIVTYPTARRVLILQHPQEQDAVLGSAQILVASLPSAKLVVGLSWRNLAAAVGEEVDVRRWAVLFPDRGAAGDGVVARSGAALEPGALEGLIVLDGTWSKAKTLWWRNPWLSKLNRLTLTPKSPSIYGNLRAEPKTTYVSTLESVGAALTLSGEDPQIEAALRRVFRTMVQRVAMPASSRLRRVDGHRAAQHRDRAPSDMRGRGDEDGLAPEQRPQVTGVLAGVGVHCAH